MSSISKIEVVNLKSVKDAGCLRAMVSVHIGSVARGGWPPPYQGRRARPPGVLPYSWTESKGGNHVDENYDGIPQELKSLPQWVCWRKDKGKNNRIEKIPMIPGGEYGASTTNPEHWSDFKTALSWHRAGHWDGIGFVFTKTNLYCGIDLDGCRDPETGKIDQGALDILQNLDSYAEYSQSGRGIHIICKAKLPGTGHHGAHVEIYNTGRFFVFTGLALEGHKTIESRQNEVDKFLQEHFPKEPTAVPPVRPQQGSDVSDEAIIRKASAARNGDKFQRLMDGDITGYDTESEADLALCNLVKFWTQDANQILSIVKQSGLYDEKWDREDYQQRTVGKALAGVGETYNWGKSQTGAQQRRPNQPRPARIPGIAAPDFALADYMPPGGFLKDYMNYMLPITEAPAQYHLFAGLLMLATVICIP